MALNKTQPEVLFLGFVTAFSPNWNNAGVAPKLALACVHPKFY